MDNEQIKIDWQALVDKLLTGSVAAMARLITHVENREPGWMQAMQLVFPHSGNASVIGVTGFGGVGKSSMVSRIAGCLVQKGKTVGVIAVDPTSPISRGALLGDRIRMTDVEFVEGVFIRSMATKGFWGGLNQSVRDVIRIMDAFGKDFVIIETVGAGQNEVDVAKVVETVVLLCAPGQGDTIQYIKAGIMEIADIFVVNKADLDGSDRVVADIEDMLQLCHHTGQSRPPVIKASAKTGIGIDEIIHQIEKRAGSSLSRYAWRRKMTIEDIMSLLSERIAEITKLHLTEKSDVNEIIDAVITGRIDPYSLVDEMLVKFTVEKKH